MLITISLQRITKALFSISMLFNSGIVVGMIPSLHDETMYPFNKTKIDILYVDKKNEFEDVQKLVQNMLDQLYNQKFVSHFDIDKLRSVKDEVVCYIDKLQDHSSLLKQLVTEKTFKIDINNDDHVKQAKLLVRSLLQFYQEIATFNKYPNMGYTSTRFPFLNPVIEKAEDEEQRGPNRLQHREKKFVNGILHVSKSFQHSYPTVDQHYVTGYLEE